MDVTDIKIMPSKPLTLGTVQLGMNYGVANKNGIPNQDTAYSILQNAINNGINIFDTAQAYEKSETVLGDFFKHKDKPLFITKMSLEVDRHTKYDDIERQCYNILEN
ncbi:aldo/keto reductase, partial [Virgibacillus sp. W0430]|uniref:aldo/keto reductase n=1 Tax=Virgibacillus sp. W0430 TaxID=3391580 RepID=UPI003F48D4D9